MMLTPLILVFLYYLFYSCTKHNVATNDINLLLFSHIPFTLLTPTSCITALHLCWGVGGWGRHPMEKDFSTQAREILLREQEWLSMFF